MARAPLDRMAAPVEVTPGTSFKSSGTSDIALLRRWAQDGTDPVSADNLRTIVLPRVLKELERITAAMEELDPGRSTSNTQVKEDK